MYMCMCVYICVSCTLDCVYSNMRTWAHERSHIYKCAYLHIDVYIYTYFSIFAYLYVCIFDVLHICIFAYLHICILACLHIPKFA